VRDLTALAEAPEWRADASIRAAQAEAVKHLTYGTQRLAAEGAWLAPEERRALLAEGRGLVRDLTALAEAPEWRADARIRAAQAEAVKHLSYAAARLADASSILTPEAGAELVADAREFAQRLQRKLGAADNIAFERAMIGLAQAHGYLSVASRRLGQDAWAAQHALRIEQIARDRPTWGRLQLAIQEIRSPGPKDSAPNGSTEANLEKAAGNPRSGYSLRITLPIGSGTAPKQATAKTTPRA
jgi:hypothetical protein